MRKLTTVVMFAFVIVLPAAVNSRTIWQDRNIYASGTNLNVGDVIVVNINDVSQLRFNLTFNNDNSYNIVSNPDTTITGFLPNIASQKKVTNSEKADLSGKGGLVLTIASRVVNRQADGKLTIAGAREYSFNGKINRFAVTGIVDPELIKGRSILSKNIADFRLEIRGILERGTVNIERQALQEGEASSTGLTEEEKQRIIIDYLNKMLREMSR